VSVLDSTMAAGRFSEIRVAIESEGETLYEELASTLIHIVGAVLAAAALALLVVLASFTGSAKAVATCAIYGSTVFLTFLFSAMYHGIWHRTTKAVFLMLDHCSIFVLIAGTYTPVVLLALPPALGWTLFGVLWGLAVMGMVARLWIGHLHWVLIPIFVAMGWLGLLWGDTLFTHLGNGGGWLLLSGGFAYTGGLVFFLWRKLPFNHALWHFCVLGGAVCHFLLVAIYALPDVP
jgi:hemolysin III